MTKVPAEIWSAAQPLHCVIQTVIAGHPAGVAFVAVQTSMEAVIGFSSESFEELDRLVDALAGDLKKNVRLNWDVTREARARAPGSGRA